MSTKLKEYLKERGVSKEELAYNTGIPYSSLHALVNGYRTNTTISRAKKIISVLGCKFEDIF